MVLPPALRRLVSILLVPHQQLHGPSSSAPPTRQHIARTSSTAPWSFLQRSADSSAYCSYLINSSMVLPPALRRLVSILLVPHQQLHGPSSSAPPTRQYIARTSSTAPWSFLQR